MQVLLKLAVGNEDLTILGSKLELQLSLDLVAELLGI